MLDVAIAELGRQAVCRMQWFEVAVRRLYAVEVAMEHGTWEVAHHLDEATIGHSGVLHEVLQGTLKYKKVSDAVKKASNRPPKIGKREERASVSRLA